MQEVKKYPAKLLLFGEHTVLKGSSSLAVPYPSYHMSWADKMKEHPSWLVDYCNYLSQECNSFLDIDTLNSWIENKTISANIPIGYGLGSSGALTAAIYDVAQSDDVGDQLDILQQRLGLMESFFHGKSSGFDPLISYLQSPILRKDGELHILESDDVSIPINCYLLDSGSARSGKDMIKLFSDNYNLNKSKAEDLAQTNNMITNHSLRDSNTTDYYTLIKKISQLQQEVMPYMIVEHLKDLWQEGLDTDDYYIKICGAGGGGYYLVFSLQEISNLSTFQLQRVNF